MSTTSHPDAEPREIGSRLELFVDEWLIDRLEGASLRIHSPVAREVVMTFEKPWEGNTCGYFSFFKDGDIFRAYYRGCHFDWKSRRITHEVACYAESKDGINWVKPNLGLFEFEGSSDNNIVWMGAHNFTPFKDENPACPEDSRYKAIASCEGGLMVYGSPDGIHWRELASGPVITEGAFDSQNLAFWDPLKKRYVEFHRAFRDGRRDIMTCFSSDFIHWSKPVFLDYDGGPLHHLYTNAVRPYFRAPHIYLGFPKRFLPERKKVPDHPYDGLSDCVLMTSRDGLSWRIWQDAFLRPGPQRERWWERNNMASWGMLVTKSPLEGAPDEISMYFNEAYYTDDLKLRRFTIRMDGFVSVNAPYSGGELLTRPLVFSGSELVLNYSTSAAGSILVEVADRDGVPMKGFEVESCDEIYGDELEGVVSWRGKTDLSSLQGQPVRLRFLLRDADLYSLRFRSRGEG